MKFKELLLVGLLLILAPDFSMAQISSAENQACNQNFARALVEQQVSESKMVAETDKRIKMLLRAGDFLWKFDEATARKYFSEAFKVAADRYYEKKAESQKKTTNQSGAFIIYEPDYRMQVIRAIAQKDSEWSKKLTEQILAERQKASEEKSNTNNSGEINDLIQIAQDNVKTNPNLSRYLFRRLMNYPLDYYWYFALYGIAKENRQLADDLYSELLGRYANETPHRLLFLTAYPFVSERIFGLDKYRYGTFIPENLTPNQGLQRQFLETFFRRTSLFANNPDEFTRPPDQYRQPEVLYLVSAFEDIEPYVLQNFPDLLQRFSEVKAQANSLLNAQNRQDLEKRQKENKKLGMGFEEKLKLLEEADSEGKLTDAMIIGLVTWGERTEEEFKLLAWWLEKIQDEKARRQTINYFYFKRSERARKDKRFDEAKKYAEKVEEIDHGAVLYFELAKEQLQDANQSAQVSETLYEVSKMAQKSPDSIAKVQVLLGLAAIYEKVNHASALDLLGEAVKVINKLENPDIFTNFISRQIITKDYSFVASISAPGYNLESTFQEISKKDFELSLAHANSLNDKYFRTLAVIAVAKNCVQNAPKKAR
jgi:hypothetical protein